MPPMRTRPIVSVLTPIDYDHQKWLGDSLAKIASEKAGIIKPQGAGRFRPATRGAADVIRARAQECEAPLDFVRQPFDRFPIALSGTHQQQNAALAISALHTADIAIDKRRSSAD